VGNTSRRGQPETFPSVQLIRADGTLDSSFQSASPPIDQILISRNGLFFSPNKIFFFQPNGKILGGVTASEGHTDSVPDPKGKFFAIRWLANGSLDSNFGTNGVTVADMDFYGGRIVSAVPHADGRSSWLMDQDSDRNFFHPNLTVWNVSSHGALKKTHLLFRPDMTRVAGVNGFRLNSDESIDLLVTQTYGLSILHFGRDGAGR
jgi:hypothetical protein